MSPFEASQTSVSKTKFGYTMYIIMHSCSFAWERSDVQNSSRDKTLWNASKVNDCSM